MDILGLQNLTEVKHIGFNGATTFGFMNKQMRKLPKANVVILDIGCNDFRGHRTGKVAAANVVEIIKTFVDEYGVKYGIAFKATPIQPPKNTPPGTRMRPGFMESYNNNIAQFNKYLEKYFDAIPFAEVQEHTELMQMIKNGEDWSDDGLHPLRQGTKAYVKSLRRAIVKAQRMIHETQTSSARGFHQL